MAYTLPTQGEPNWGDKINGSLEYLRGIAEAAKAASDSAVSTANSAASTANSFSVSTDAQTAKNITAGAQSQAAIAASIAQKANTLPASSDFWQFPTAVMGSVQINTGTNRHVTTTSPSGTPYAIWWDSRNRPTVGQWNALTRTWNTSDLSQAPGNPMRSPAPNDDHNSLSIAVDGDGYIHVWGNHHDVLLRYARSANPNDITSWTTPGMIGTEENQVTYPEAIRLPNGNLLMTYRNGVSGNGDQYLNLYTTSSKSWSRVSMVFKGTSPVSPDESAYPDQIVVGPDGALNWFYMWRVDDTMASSHDLSYIRSTDNGVTWTTIDGTPMTLPIKPSDTAPVVTGGAGFQTGLIANSGASVDSNNVPHITKWTGSSGAWTLRHYYYSGGSWHNDVVTAHGVGGTRPAAWSSGNKTWAIYAKAGRLTSIRVAPTVGTEVDHGWVPVNQWEGSTDPTYTAGFRTYLGPSHPDLLAGTWAGVLTLTPTALDGLDVSDVKIKPTPAPPSPVVPQLGPKYVPGFYYTPATGNRASTTMTFSSGALDCRGGMIFAGSDAHIASLALRLTTGGSADSTYRLLLVEVTSPTTGIIRAVSAAQNGSVTGNIEVSVEGQATPSNILAGRQYVVAAQWIGGATSPTVQSIPGSSWNDPSIGQATLAGALIPSTNYSGFAVTASGGGALPSTAKAGDAVTLAPTGTSPLVAFKVTAAP